MIKILGRRQNIKLKELYQKDLLLLHDSWVISAEKIFERQFKHTQFRQFTVFVCMLEKAYFKRCVYMVHYILSMLEALGSIHSSHKMVCLK